MPLYISVLLSPEHCNKNQCKPTIEKKNFIKIDIRPMAEDKSRIRVRENLIQKGDRLVEAEYIYDEIQPNGKINQRKVSVKKEEFDNIVATLKKPTLSFDDFIKITRPLLMGNQAAEDIPEAFQLLDRDKSETIDIHELSLFMPAIVPDSNPYMLLRYFQTADSNNDYKLSLEEFTAFIKKGVIRDIALGRNLLKSCS